MELVVWYSPYWTLSEELVACKTSIPPKSVLLVSVNALVSTKSAVCSKPVFEVPKSIWALVSNPVVTLASAEAVKSIFAVAVELVAGYSPICKSVVPEVALVVCKTSTEANSSPLFSAFVVVVVWKSVNSFVFVVWKASVDELIWASKPISLVVVWIWLKSSVAVGIASTDVEIFDSIMLLVDETGYSP